MGMEEIAGYAVRRQLGAGSAGTVQLVRDLGSGRHAVLKRVPASGVPSEGEFRRDLAIAGGLDHPHVAALLEVRQTAGEWQLVSEYVAAGTLTELLQRRGPLSTAELVTLLAPLAQALAAVHRAGLVHGHLGPGDVMFAADGRPVLTDVGLARSGGDPRVDLAALAGLATLAGADPAVFGPKVFAGDAETVALRVLAIGPPAPIDLGFGVQARISGGPAPAGPAHRRRPSRGVAVLACAGILALLAAGLTLVSRDQGRVPSAATTPTVATPSPTAPGTPTPSPAASTPVRWHAVLRALDDRRAEAFATLDLAGLDEVYVAGSPPWQVDRALIASYRERRLRIDGLRLRIDRVAVVSESPGAVVLRVVDHLVGGVAVGTSGQRTVLPAAPPAARLITVTRAGEGWRIGRIVAAT